MRTSQLGVVLSGVLLLCLSVCSGCTICAPGYLDDYATVGGKWQRSDPAYGRVGSVFSDPGTTVSMADSLQSDEVIYGDGVESAEMYDSYAPVKEYYEESSSIPSPSYEDGVIILGEDW